MKKVASKFVLLFVSILLFASFISPVNSSAASDTSGDDVNTMEVEAATEKVKELGSELNSYIKENPTADDEEILNDFFANGNTINGEELQALNDAAKETVDIQEAVNATEEDIEEAQILETSEVANREITVYKNGVVGIEEAADATPTATGGFSIMATKSKSGSATKTYYSWTGLKLFTVSVSAKFNYTGSKASYAGGLDYYYKRGTLSAWTVTEWKGFQERSGTSHYARANGNFQFGIQAKGVGLVMQEMYIRHTVTCSKSGKITKNFYKR